MALHKISNRYPNYQDIYFKGGDLKGMIMYSAEHHEVGHVSELLIDESDRLKYLVVDLFADSTKQNRVLFPIRSCVKTTDEKSIYARHLTLHDISQLEPYTTESQIAASGPIAIPSHTSSQVIPQVVSVEQSAPVEMTSPVESATTVSHISQQTTLQPESKRSEVSGSSIPLYEERLRTQKQRIKTGEVKISKQIVTDTIETSTPIKREKIIIEIESIYGGDTRIDFDEAKVAEDGTISMGIYEERAEVCRQVLPYQNVSIRKEVVDDVVTTQQTLRREELSVNPEGLPYVDWADS